MLIRDTAAGYMTKTLVYLLFLLHSALWLQIACQGYVIFFVAAVDRVCWMSSGVMVQDLLIMLITFEGLVINPCVSLWCLFMADYTTVGVHSYIGCFGQLSGK